MSGEKPEYRKKQEEASRKRQEGEQHADRQQIVATLERGIGQAKAAHDEDTAAEKQRDTWERRRFWLDLAAVIAVFVAAAFAGGQLISMRGQQTVMQGQLNEMQLEQRPWIKTEANAITDLTVDHTPGQEQSVFVMIGLDITNTGKTPAFFALPNNRSGERFLHNIDVEQSDLCSAFDGPNAAKIPEDGLTVFPGQTKTYRVAVTIPPTEVAEIRRRAKGQIGPITVTPIVYGCISYKSALGGKWHLSGFAYVIDTKKNDTCGPWFADYWKGRPGSL